MKSRLLHAGPMIIVGVLLATLWTLVIGFAQLQQQRLLDSRRDQLRVINSGVAQHTAALLQGIESDLQVVEHWLRRHPADGSAAGADLAPLLQALGGAWDEGLVQIGFAAADGRPATLPDRLPGARPAPGATRVPPGPGLAIGDPVRATGADAGWHLPLVQRLGTPVGGAHALVAWVDLGRLGRVHDRLRSTAAGAVLLTRGDGVMLARTPSIDRLMGRNVRTRGNLTGAAASQASGSFVTDASATDGVARLVSFERLERYPVSVLVSESIEEGMATLRHRQRTAISVCAAISLIAVWTAVVLMRSQRRVRQAQSELATVSDASPMGLFRTGLDGRISYANAAFHRILGLGPQERPDGWLQRLDPAVREAAEADWLSAVRDARPLDTTLPQFQLPDGRPMVLALRSVPLWLDDELAGQVGVIEDITERAQQQKAQRTLHAFFEASTDLIAQIEPGGSLRYVNPAGRRYLRLAPDQPLDGLTYRQFTPPGRVAQVRDEIMPTALARGVWVGETSLLALDGHEWPMSQMLLAHRGADGKVENISLLMRDIGPQIEARDALQRSASILRTVADSLPVIVSVIDRDERMIFTNRTFDRWLDRRGDDSIGRSVREVIGDDAYAQSRPNLERAYAGETAIYHTDHIDPRGKRRFLERTLIPFRGPDGQVAGIVALAQDITSHKLEQRRLQEASQTDALTGAVNRAGFDQLLAAAITRSGRERTTLALLCVDLDRFKPVNDNHGHPVGDALLKTVVLRLRGALRPSDTVARLGGDEFAVLLDETSQAGADAVARKLVATLSAPFRIGALELHIGASVGGAIARPGEDAATLVRRADAALYASKRAGRGRHTMADDATAGDEASDAPAASDSPAGA